MMHCMKKITIGLLLAVIMTASALPVAAQNLKLTDPTAPSSASGSTLDAGSLAPLDSSLAPSLDPDAPLPDVPDVSLDPSVDAATRDAINNNELADVDSAKETLNKIANYAAYLHRLFHPLVNFFAFKIGAFFTNDYIYEGAMGEMLKRIWVISRNLVNIFFVLILLGLAIKEIIPGLDEGGDLKKNLVKFTLLLIAVNFSWLAMKVTLDAANIVTNVAFAIPQGVGSAATIDFKECTVTDNKTTGMCMPSAIYFPVDAVGTRPTYLEQSECGGLAETYGSAWTADGKPILDKQTPQTKKATICWDNFNLNTYDSSTAVVYMTYGMAKIQNLVYASSGGEGGLLQLSVAVVMSLIIQTAYVLALLSLFIALVLRMAALWIFVGFSPFLILIYFFKGTENVGEEFGIDAFLRWAFVPAGVAAVFSVSFLMVTAGQLVDFKLSDPGLIDAHFYNVNTLLMGMDSIQSFVWLLITLAVLWIGTFTTLAKVPMIGHITDKIKTMGTEAAGFVAKAPLWAPIIPVTNPDGTTRSASLSGTYNDLHNQMMSLEHGGNISAKDIGESEKAARAFVDSDRSQILNFAEGGKQNAAEIASKFNVGIQTLQSMGDKFKDLLKTGGFKDEKEINLIYQVITDAKDTAKPSNLPEAAKALGPNPADAHAPADKPGTAAPPAHE